MLHTGNGAPMNSLTMRAKMYDLGFVTSRNRPRVSDDNPYSESLIKTVKYHSRWPCEEFKSLDETVNG
jgi:putative transposase